MQGVTVFFVLSGYLITRLLLSEHKGTGRIDLKGFWQRRLRRLVPAIVTVIRGDRGALHPVQPRHAHQDEANIIPSALFVNNWWQIFNQQSYFNAIGNRRHSLISGRLRLKCSSTSYGPWRSCLRCVTVSPRSRSVAPPWRSQRCRHLRWRSLRSRHRPQSHLLRHRHRRLPSFGSLARTRHQHSPTSGPARRPARRIGQ